MVKQTSNWTHIIIITWTWIEFQICNGDTNSTVCYLWTHILYSRQLSAAREEGTGHNKRYIVYIFERYEISAISIKRQFNELSNDTKPEELNCYFWKYRDTKIVYFSYYFLYIWQDHFPKISIYAWPTQVTFCCNTSHQTCTCTGCIKNNDTFINAYLYPEIQSFK